MLTPTKDELTNKYASVPNFEKLSARYNGDNAAAPSVSVIVPVYNTSNYLYGCLDSLKSQTLDNIEIICIDDGSQDNSLDILLKYSEDDDRFTILSGPNKGLSTVRNKGLVRAHGEYIQFLDSDDALSPGALEMLYSTAQKENLDVVYFDALLRYETHEIEEKFEHSKQYYNTPLFLQKAVTGQDLFLRLKHNNIYRPSACLQILKREFLLSTGEKFYEGIIYEDNLFTFKTMLQAKRVMKLDEQLYIRLYRADSIMTSARTIKNLRSYLRCVSQMMAFSENFPADDILKKEMAHSISQLCLRINEIYKKLPAEEKEKAKMFNPLEQMWLNMTLTKKPGRMKTVVRKFSTLIHRCKDYGVWQTMKYVWGKIFH